MANLTYLQFWKLQLATLPIH